MESQYYVDEAGAVRWDDNGSLVDERLLAGMGFPPSAVAARRAAVEREEQARLARMAEDAAALAAWESMGRPPFGMRIASPAFGLRIGGVL